MYAAVDLGSNSFRLHIGRHEGDTIRVLKSMREPIRLAAGLDAQGNLTNKVKARKSRNANEVIVTWNSKTYTFPMKTVKAEKTEIIYKKPHPIIYQFYTERARKLETYIAEQKLKVKENAPTELRDLRTNIFVEAQLANIVEANMNDAVQTLETMALKVEKIRFSYESLMEG